MPENQRRLMQALLLAALFLGACQAVEETRIDEAAGTVPFTISAAEPTDKNDPDTKAWLATCGTEKFLIDLTIPPPDAQEPISFTTGKLCRHHGSDADRCLDSIAKALEAKQVKPPRDRVDCLPFQAAVLGQNLSRGGGNSLHAGAFTSDSPGTWIATKVFVADGEGEFFLNLSPKTGEAEISIKDPEYGDVVVQELARVLAGRGPR